MKPKQKKYICTECSSIYYKLKNLFDDEEPMCDDCKELLEESDDELMEIIRRQIASYNQKLKKSK
jgi:NAD-dependent SIR2 family protein deacetylase